MASFVQRVIGAARLDAATYEEVEADPGAMGQAVGVILGVSVAAGIGAIGDEQGPGLVVGAIGSLVGWLLWAAITWLVGTRVLPTAQTQADFGQLLRTLGFSAAPGFLMVLGVVPGIGIVIGLIASLWQLAAMVVAVRQALDYDSTLRAVAVCLIGFLAYALIGSLLFAAFR